MKVTHKFITINWYNIITIEILKRLELDILTIIIRVYAIQIHMYNIILTLFFL